MAAADVPFSVTLRVTPPVYRLRAPYGGALRSSRAHAPQPLADSHGGRGLNRALGRMRPLSGRRYGYPPPSRRGFCRAAGRLGSGVGGPLLGRRVIAILNTFAGVAGLNSSPL